MHSQDDVGLVTHIQHFHPESLTTLQAEPLGWHWHLALPPWGQGSSSTSEDEQPSPSTNVEFDPAIVAAGISWQVEVHTAVWDRVDQLKISAYDIPSVHSTDEFLGTYLRHHSELQVLSVCLC